jgi:hexosaminidase
MPSIPTQGGRSSGLKLAATMPTQHAMPRRNMLAIAAGVLAGLVFGAAGTSARETDPPALVISVVPQPRYLRSEPGLYRWTSGMRIAPNGRAGRNVATLLRAYLAANGVRARIADGAVGPAVELRAASGFDRRLGAEGYMLAVRGDAVSLRANTEHGLFNGLQTLEQISQRSHGRLVSHAVTVVDWPAYAWRGMHLDVARHFFAPPAIERFIDVAAHYKLNVFHWHLTDDQAWRLRLDRYPALGAGQDQYSAAEVRRIVDYAARRYVTVVPEIEMPAHTTRLLRTYPGLACTADTLCTTGAGLAFARTAISDVMAEFPAPFVHVGGDEVPFLASFAQPQFTRQLERLVRAQHRRLVGWDEIFTPQLPPRAVVMVWRAHARAARAAEYGNDVVLASGPMYFDGAQGDAAQEPRASGQMSTLEEVYDYDVSDGLSSREAAHVLGGQANVWTEHIATTQHLFYMTLPRELALAETVWTPRERKSWASFMARLPAQFAWLEAHRYAFRIPNAAFALSGGATAFTAVPGRVQSVDAWTSARALTVRLSSPLADGVIRYAIGGAAPSAASPAYRAPFRVRIGGAPVVLRAAVFLHGRRGAVSDCVVRATSGQALRRLEGASRTWTGLVSP